MRALKQKGSLGMGLWAALAGLLPGCIGWGPVGTFQGHAASRYTGTPLQVVISQDVRRTSHMSKPVSKAVFKPSSKASHPVRLAAASQAQSSAASVSEASLRSRSGHSLGHSKGHSKSGPLPRPVQRTPGRGSGAWLGSQTLGWPVQGMLTSRFGNRRGRPHDGIDIGAPRGTAVLAAAKGEVVFAARHSGYGNLVILRHDHGLLTVYAHQEANMVRKGQRVRKGQQVGRVGATGRATGPHLHFEVRRGAHPENPLYYLPP